MLARLATHPPRHRRDVFVAVTLRPRKPVDTGSFRATNPDEDFVLYSLDNVTPDQVRDRAFNVVATPDPDDTIFDDLGAGTEYGRRVYTQADETTNLIPSPTAGMSVDCSLDNAPCGKWLIVPLNSAAVSDINAAGPLWGFGGTVEDLSSAGTQRVNVGTQVDLPPGIGAFPEFLTPQPRLVATP
ncbi:MAG: hypothetical protein MJD61_03590 [Proteobacteria bacterium]|nr:hypothetical protein [Pseudomonadota bacterium]